MANQNEQLIALLKQLDNRLSGLEHTVNEVIVKSLVDSANEYDKSQFSEKLNGMDGYGDTAAKMKTLYGDDYDLGEDLYSQSRDVEDVDSFIVEALQEINDKLNALVGTPEEVAAEAPAETPAEEDDPSLDQVSDEQLAAELAAAE